MVCAVSHSYFHPRITMIANYKESDEYQKIQQAREAYRPEFIRLLLVAEAPPVALDRFFYYPQVKTDDWLYLGVVKALYGDIPPKQLRSDKPSYLKKIMDEGIFLVDLAPIPVCNHEEVRAYGEDFMTRLAALPGFDKRSSRIILLKANVYDTLFTLLSTEGYRVIDERIPFPACGQQRNFALAMNHALHTIGLR